MKDILRKGLLLGLGAASLTKKKTEKIVKGLVKKGAVSSKESVVLARRILAEAKQQEAKLRKIGEAEAKRALKKIGIVSLGEAKKLKQKVAVLEKTLKQKSKKAVEKVYRKVKKTLR